MRVVPSTELRQFVATLVYLLIVRHAEYPRGQRRLLVSVCGRLHVDTSSEATTRSDSACVPRAINTSRPEHLAGGEITFGLPISRGSAPRCVRTSRQTRRAISTLIRLLSSLFICGLGGAEILVIRGQSELAANKRIAPRMRAPVAICLIFSLERHA